MGPIILSAHDLCRTPIELLGSEVFSKLICSFLESLRARGSELHDYLRDHALSNDEGAGSGPEAIAGLLTLLSARTLEDVAADNPEYASLADSPSTLHELVEELYNYWRKLERFILLEEEYNATNIMTSDYHNWFIDTTQSFEALVRETYRRIAYNITGDLPKVYRQLPSGAGVGALIERIPWDCPHGEYGVLAELPFIQLVVIEPPLIFYPTRNFRRGAIKAADDNPLRLLRGLEGGWYCFPAKVGLLLIFIYFHQSFLHLGTSLCNLFELASGEEVSARAPDGILVFGGAADSLSPEETYFFEDDDNSIVVGYVNGVEEHDYFGYLKKTALTLHNVVMINRGMLPLHGAMAHIRMGSGKSANIVIVGDSGAGKSETLEAFRSLAGEENVSMKVIFDDMGVLGSDNEGKVVAYGTEIGAFVRLDDLQPGYAYSEVDRSIFMNPQLNNARVVIPVSSYDYITSGHGVDTLLYANNYEEVDDGRPLLEFFPSIEDALRVFEAGARMAKGTTDEAGLVHSYFANPFGAAQKRREHDAIARYFFERLQSSGCRIGMLRTRLGLEGREMSGPEEAARAILDEFFS